MEAHHSSYNNKNVAVNIVRWYCEVFMFQVCFMLWCFQGSICCCYAFVGLLSNAAVNFFFHNNAGLIQYCEVIVGSSALQLQIVFVVIMWCSCDMVLWRFRVSNLLVVRFTSVNLLLWSIHINTINHVTAATIFCVVVLQLWFHTV